MTDPIARTIRRTADAAGSVTVSLAPHHTDVGAFGVFLGEAYLGSIASRTTQTRKVVPGTRLVLLGAEHVEWVATGPETSGRAATSHLQKDDAIRALLTLAGAVAV